MPRVFVHGVPDTQHVWDHVVRRLNERNVVCLSLPGFGKPVPPGFDATKESYVDWLIGELTAVPKPIDLVGHDWGATLVLRAISLQPDLVRTWATGSAPIDPDYEWHETAQLWQTPGVGEQVMEAMTPEAVQAALAAQGVPEADATATANNMDATMKRCILALYRSAVNVGKEWTSDLARISAPGLVMWGENDPFAAPRYGARLAERTKARFVSFADCSHWWQLERPIEVVTELQLLWGATS